jgi:hypothetical protein
MIYFWFFKSLLKPRDFGQALGRLLAPTQPSIFFKNLFCAAKGAMELCDHCEAEWTH